MKAKTVKVKTPAQQAAVNCAAGRHVWALRNGGSRACQWCGAH